MQCNAMQYDAINTRYVNVVITMIVHFFFSYVNHVKKNNNVFLCNVFFVFVYGTDVAAVVGSHY